MTEAPQYETALHLKIAIKNYCERLDAHIAAASSQAKNEKLTDGANNYFAQQEKELIKLKDRLFAALKKATEGGEQ